MEEPPKKSNWKFWIYLSPLYLLLAVPLVKWTMRNNSSNFNLTNDEYKAFNSDVGNVKKKKIQNYNPELNDVGYTLNYRSGGSDNGTDEEIGWGSKEGYLLAALAQNMTDHKVIDELYNNKWMIQGFMARASVQDVMFSSDNIKKMLSDKNKVNAFLAKPAIRSLLNHPDTVQIILDSDFTKTLLEDDASKDFMRDSQAIAAILTDNRALVRLIKIPVVKKFIVTSPQTVKLAEAVGWK